MIYEHEQAYAGKRCFMGDLHNHCGISYGHGLLEDALRNAELQLDFVSVTGHAGWPDIDEQDMPEEVKEYHRAGFEKLKKNREWYADDMKAHNVPGKFVTFGGYELHSFRFGDYTVIQKDPRQSHIIPADGDSLARFIAETRSQHDDIILMPHHIGYKKGFRGIDWQQFNPEASPLVEIISMHGLSEGPAMPFPYLHTMGPLDEASSMQAGLALGHLAGFTGSTDHHSAHPGSYGYGRTMVWADSLTRESIWQAFLERRVYAVSGDPIICRFSVNGAPMGSEFQEDKKSNHPRELYLKIRGCNALSRVEILKNNTVFHQKNYIHDWDLSAAAASSENKAHDDQYTSLLRGKLIIEMGWGEKKHQYNWDVQLKLHGLKKVRTEPRFRGIDVVDPLDETGDLFAFTEWSEPDAESISLKTATFGNATAVTSQTQGVCIDVEGPDDGSLELVVQGKTYRFLLRDLLRQGEVMYTAGFLSPAVKIHRFVPENFCNDELLITDDRKAAGDMYYARVFQENGQAAWISPVKVL